MTHRNIKLDEGLDEEVSRRARSEERNFSQQVRHYLRRGIAEDRRREAEERDRQR